MSSSDKTDLGGRILGSASNFVARPITSGPSHHFFGYYGIQPWDATGHFLLCLEVPFDDRPPGEKDKATVGLVELSGSKFIPLAETRAWNFQQGAMMHWLQSSPDPEIIFNDCDNGRPISVILNVRTKERRTLPRAISALSHDRKTALSINFGRLQWARPGYGYAGVYDPFANDPQPDEDGIFLLNLEKGEEKRIVTFADALVKYDKRQEMKNESVVFNHTIYSPDDGRFAFLIQWITYLLPKWARISRLSKLGHLNSIMFTANLDGTGLHPVADFEDVSHYDWRNSDEILMWAKLKDRYGFFLVKDGKSEYRRISESTLTEDGHCSYSPDGRWILVDTYPNNARYITLKILLWEKEQEFVLGRFYSPARYTEQIRCDLHPRWNRRGDFICFDSVHEGSRQVYVMDVSSLTDK